MALILHRIWFSIYCTYKVFDYRRKYNKVIYNGTFIFNKIKKCINLTLQLISGMQRRDILRLYLESIE